MTYIGVLTVYELVTYIVGKVTALKFEFCKFLYSHGRPIRRYVVRKKIMMVGQIEIHRTYVS